MGVEQTIQVGNSLLESEKGGGSLTFGRLRIWTRATSGGLLPKLLLCFFRSGRDRLHPLQYMKARTYHMPTRARRSLKCIPILQILKQRHHFVGLSWQRIYMQQHGEPRYRCGDAPACVARESQVLGNKKAPELITVFCAMSFEMLSRARRSMIPLQCTAIWST